MNEKAAQRLRKWVSPYFLWTVNSCGFTICGLGNWP